MNIVARRRRLYLDFRPTRDEQVSSAVLIGRIALMAGMIFVPIGILGLNNSWTYEFIWSTTFILGFIGIAVSVMCWATVSEYDAIDQDDKELQGKSLTIEEAEALIVKLELGIAAARLQ